MTAEYTNARDDMLRHFTTAWPAAANAVGFATAPTIRYQGVSIQPEIPDPKTYWVRISTKNVLTRQTGFVALDAEAKSAKQHTTIGLLFVQVFAPKVDIQAFRKGGMLAEAAQGIFQNRETPCSVIFRNVRVVELPDETEAYRFNVEAEYEYDQLNV